MFSFLWTVGSFIVVIAVLVFVHEFGHFWVARKCGVIVQRFSIGFGKVLWRKTDKQGTEFVISLIPLGGYVKMLDEQNEEVPPELLSKAFNRQSRLVRGLIYIAGPLANFLFALFAFWVVYLVGIPTVKPIIEQIKLDSIAAQAAFPVKSQIIAIDDEEIKGWNDVNLVLASKIGNNNVEFTLQDLDSDKTFHRTINLATFQFDPSKESAFTALGIEPRQAKVENIIAKVSPNSPAAKSGLQPGDKIIAVNGEAVDWQKFVAIIQQHEGQTMQVKVEQQGIIKTISLTPQLNEKGRPFVGLMPVVKPLNPQDIELQRYGVFSALTHSFELVRQLSIATFKIVGKLFTGDVSLTSLGGPISIAQGAGISSENGVVPFLHFMALISINLGIMNLLPLPILDGGQIVFLFIEGITKKTITDKIRNIAYRIAAVLLVVLTVFVLFNDIMRL